VRSGEGKREGHNMEKGEILQSHGNTFWKKEKKLRGGTFRGKELFWKGRTITGSSPEREGGGGGEKVLNEWKEEKRNVETEGEALKVSLGESGNKEKGGERRKGREGRSSKGGK